MKIVNTLMDQWGGLVIGFPAVRNRGENTFIYMHKQKPRAVIAAYKMDEDWTEHLDIMIDEGEFNDIITMEDLLMVPVVIAIEFNNRQVFAKASNFYQARNSLIQEGKAFLPKESFETLTRQ